jgi:hypothetical protein
MQQTGVEMIDLILKEKQFHMEDPTISFQQNSQRATPSFGLAQYAYVLCRYNSGLCLAIVSIDERAGEIQ